MWPCVPIIGAAKCAIGVLIFEWPKDVFPMVAHVLGISQF